MTGITVAALQLAFTDDMKTDIANTAALVLKAAKKGATVILPPELFQGHYFCRQEHESFFDRAWPVAEHPAVIEMQKIAAAHGVAIPTSIFEREDRKSTRLNSSH